MADIFKNAGAWQRPAEGTYKYKSHGQAYISYRTGGKNDVTISCLAKVGSGHSNIKINVPKNAFKQMLENMMYVDRALVIRYVTELDNVFEAYEKRESAKFS